MQWYRWSALNMLLCSVQCVIFGQVPFPATLRPLVYYTILQYDIHLFEMGYQHIIQTCILDVKFYSVHNRGFIEVVYVNPFTLYLNNILNASDIVVSCVNYSYRLLPCSYIIIILYRVIHFSLKHLISKKLWMFLKIFIPHNFKRLENKIIYFTNLYRCYLWPCLHFLMTTCVFNPLF